MRSNLSIIIFTKFKKTFMNKSSEAVHKFLIASVISTSLVLIPTTPAFSAAPVGSGTVGTDTNRNSSIPVGPSINGVNKGGDLAFALANANATAEAVMVSSNSATQLARSLGLVAANADSASGLGLTQTATVALGGVLSLYTLTATSLAISWNGGTVSASASASTNLVGSAFTSASTAIAFTTAAAASGVAHTASILWTAPSTAGTYVIETYLSTANSGAVVPTSTNPTLGTKTSKITVTVGGSHPAVGGTNSPATLGGVNASMFTAVASNSGASAVVHPSGNLGTGETTALSKGLVYKDTSFGTAQTAQVLPGATLSLYAYVSTTVAFTSSGGSFSQSTGATATYSSSLRTTLFIDALPNAMRTVATLWTAPTTIGTYTVSLYGANGIGTAPTELLPAVSLAANLTVSVVAASAGGSYSAPYSACNTAVSTAAITAGAGTAGIDSSAAVADGGAWYIDFDLNDAYNANLDSGNIVVSATNGALVNLGSGGTAPVAGTAATKVEFGGTASRTVRIDQPTAGAPLTTTVTISYNGTVVCTKTVTIRGKVAKLAVANVGTQSLTGSTGSAQWMYQEIGLWASGLFTVLATDSAGNIVSTSGLGTFAPVAATLTTTVGNISDFTYASSNSSTSASRFSLGAWTCTGTAGEAQVKVKFTTTATGEAIESPAFKARCAGSPDTYTVSLDKSSYIQGDLATATVQFLDSKGNKANSVVAVGANTWNLPMMTGVSFTMASGASATAVTKTDGSVAYTFTVGTTTAVTTGTYTGVVEYSSPANGVKSTPTYKISTGGDTTSFSEILKSVVALIASINKQIQALQKLIVNKKR